MPLFGLQAAGPAGEAFGLAEPPAGCERVEEGAFPPERAAGCDVPEAAGCEAEAEPDRAAGCEAVDAEEEPDPRRPAPPPDGVTEAAAVDGGFPEPPPVDAGLAAATLAVPAAPARAAAGSRGAEYP